MATQTSETIARDNIGTLALEGYVRDQVFDQIVTAHPALMWMAGRDLPELKKYALIEDMPNEVLETKTALMPAKGRNVQVLLEVDENDTVDWVTPWEGIDVDNQELYTRAYFDWTHLLGGVAISGIEEAMVEGMEAIADAKLLQKQTDSLKKRITKKLSRNLWISGGTKAALSIPDLIETSPTSTLGGISRSTETWWKNRQVNLGSTLDDESKINRIHLNCSRGNSMDTPTFYVTTQNIYEQILIFSSDKQRYPTVQRTNVAQLGFDHVLYAGRAVITFDDNVPANRMYALSKGGLKLAINEQLRMKMGPWTVKSGSMVRAAVVVLSVQLVPTEPRRLGVLHNITNIS